MAKQIKRFWFPIIAITALLALSIIQLAHSQSGGASVSPEDMAASSKLRQSIGLGNGDLLVAMSTDFAHKQIIDSVAAEITNHKDLMSLVESKEVAEEQLISALAFEASDEVLTDAYTSVEQSTDALVAATQDLMPKLQIAMSPKVANLSATVVENLDLDEDLRTISLNDAVHTKLLDATRTRDQVLRDPKNWHNKAACQQANNEYEKALKSTLSMSQYEELLSNRQLLKSRRVEMLLAEAEALKAAESQQ